MSLVDSTLENHSASSEFFRIRFIFRPQCQEKAGTVISFLIKGKKREKRMKVSWLRCVYKVLAMLILC